MKTSGQKSTTRINTAATAIADLRSPEFLGVQPRSEGHPSIGYNRWSSNVLSQSEREALDDLVGLALLDNSIYERLIVKRDRSLLAAFGLSDNAKNWVLGVEATTLKDFAQAIVATIRSPYLDNPVRAAA